MTKRQLRYKHVLPNRPTDFIKICRTLQKELNLNTYQYDVVYRYIHERFSHASARSYLKGTPVKDIITSQREAEKIYAVAKNFVESNKIKLNELIID